MKLLHCNYCGKRKPMLTPDRDKALFLYCSHECREAHLAERVARSHKEAKTHDPAIRRPKTEGEMRAMGMMLRGSIPVSDSPTPVELKPKRPKRKKQVRRCGKCGEVGHNARTCGRKRLRVPEAKPVSRPSVTREPGAPKPVGKRKAAKKQSRKRRNTCGKCGQKGHNARTCSRKN